MPTSPRAFVFTLLIVLATGAPGAGPARNDQRPTPESNRFDVVVYGGTAGGVLTAVSTPPAVPPYTTTSNRLDSGVGR